MPTRLILLVIVLSTGYATAAEDQGALTAIISILEVGADNGALPADFQLTLPPSGAGHSHGLGGDSRGWRFGRHQVWSLNKQSEPVASAPWDGAQALCRLLLASDLPGLAQAPRRASGASRKAETSLTGGRSIELSVGDHRLLLSGDNGPTGQSKTERDLKAFRWLYHTLRDRADHAMHVHQVLWGESVQGLQLGIVADVMKPGEADLVSVRTFLRAVGNDPVALIAPVYACLLGDGIPVMLSGLELKPMAGGPKLSLGYRKWNHLTIRDIRHEQEAPPQQIIDARGAVEVELNKEDANLFQKVIEPGVPDRMETVCIDLGTGKSQALWGLKKGQVCQPGAYELRAVFRSGSPQSPWQGRLHSAPLVVEVVQQGDGLQARVLDNSQTPAPGTDGAPAVD